MAFRPERYDKYGKCVSEKVDKGIKFKEAVSMCGKPLLEELCCCEDVFTEDERKHLEESLHSDLDGYWEEVKDVFKKDEKSSAQEQVDNILQKDFIEWKNLSNSVFKKCKLNEWSIPKNG